jgi:hypothetical protein
MISHNRTSGQVRFEALTEAVSERRVNLSEPFRGTVLMGSLDLADHQAVIRTQASGSEHGADEQDTGTHAEPLQPDEAGFAPSLAISRIQSL